VNSRSVEAIVGVVVGKKREKKNIPDQEIE
jgi:hypothetical protein